MNNNQDLKKLFHNPQLPDVDLTEKVMRQIYAEQQPKLKFMVKYRISLLVIIGLLVTASTGVAMVQYNSIKNKDGEVVYQTKPLKEAPLRDYTEEEGKRMSMSERLKIKLLPAGSAALFYIVPHNPNMELDLRFKPFVYKDISALRAKMKDELVPIKDTVHGAYQFKSARVFFDPEYRLNPPAAEEKAAIAEKLRKQAETSKKDYAMLPVEFSDKFYAIDTTYQQGKNEISVRINKNPVGGDSVATSYWDEDIKMEQEVVTVKGVEMLYTKDIPSGTGSITWIEELADGEHYYWYDIRASTNEVTKEDLMKIAESYMK